LVWRAHDLLKLLGEEPMMPSPLLGDDLRCGLAERILVSTLMAGEHLLDQLTASHIVSLRAPAEGGVT
jgi:hypothetical protein